MWVLTFSQHWSFKLFLIILVGFSYGASYEILGLIVSILIQNKEKSISLKTMEDGGVLLHSVS